ncbi:alpha-L-fucosidase [Candidatus Latescibacterota bacterium]
MKKNLMLLFLSCIVIFSIIYSLSCADDSAETYIKLSQEALANLETVQPVPFKRTNHPDAQWFPEAGFGLFLHWGIHSVKGLEPSWAMMKNCPWQADYIDYLGWTKYNNRDSYYTLRNEFNPANYDPDKWIKAAADAGMKYAVITTKHHDGYALWPSEYGENSTKQYMDGRDLLRPFVDACRKYDVKVGFYFSPRDWGYPGYPQSMDYKTPFEFPPGWTEEQNRQAFERFYEYTVGQLSEILTRYGKIDIIWFDGMGWSGIKDIRTEKTLAWVREIQPNILINPRWGGAGDFETPEVALPDGPPEGWWENCVSWCGHWGYSPHAEFLPNLWVMTKLVKARSWGGNFLLNVGPDGNGEMRDEYYAQLAEIGDWMKICGESLIGASDVRNWQDFSNVPITKSDNKWYLHVLPTHEGRIVLTGVPEPERADHLNTGVKLAWYNYDADSQELTLNLSMTIRDNLNDVIVLTWEDAPETTVIPEK